MSHLVSRGGLVSGSRLVRRSGLVGRGGFVRRSWLVVFLSWVLGLTLVGHVSNIAWKRARSINEGSVQGIV